MDNPFSNIETRQQPSDSIKVLFLCLGNICRSPTAESIFRKKAENLGLNNFVFDSAGTADYHTGEKSDPRSIEHAEKRGYSMTHLARQITSQDFLEFDYILTMDKKNFTNANALIPTNPKAEIKMVTDFCISKNYLFVPDPYYGNENDFELVIDILESAAEGFFAK